jgi:hypothetical protein
MPLSSQKKGAIEKNQAPEKAAYKTQTIRATSHNQQTNPNKSRPQTETFCSKLGVVFVAVSPTNFNK